MSKAARSEAMLKRCPHEAHHSDLRFARTLQVVPWHIDLDFSEATSTYISRNPALKKYRSFGRGHCDLLIRSSQKKGLPDESCVLPQQLNVSAIHADRAFMLKGREI